MVTDGKRGDLGTFTLKKGVTVTGRVLDAQGKPLAGVFVEADRERGSGPEFEVLNQLIVADAIDGRPRPTPRGGSRSAPCRRASYRVMPTDVNHRRRQVGRLDPTRIARGLRPDEADDQGGRGARAAGGPAVARTW